METMLQNIPLKGLGKPWNYTEMNDTCGWTPSKILKRFRWPSEAGKAIRWCSSGVSKSRQAGGDGKWLLAAGLSKSRQVGSDRKSWI